MSEYYKKLRQKIGTQLIFSPSVIGIIRNEKDEILFVQQAVDTTWGFPAGAIEIGETPSEAVVREVYEETGLSVVPTGLLGVFGGDEFRWVYPDGNQVEYLNFVFECSVESGTLQPVDGEIGDYKYFPVDSLPPLQFSYPIELFKARTTSRTFFQKPARNK
nr:NUDIX domain-containing protein [Alicyclobacillus sp. SO9]